MGKKGNAKCTEIKDTPIKSYTYEIQFISNEKVEKIRMTATHIAQEGDDLVIFGVLEKEEIQIGAVKNWVFFSIVEDEEA